MTRMLSLPLAMIMLAGCERRAEPEAVAGEAGAIAVEAPVVRTAADTSLQWAPCPDLFPQGCELAILHGDPAKPNADALLRVPAGYAIPLHTHSSAERMMLVSGRLEVQYQGSPASMLVPGTYAYGPANLPHRATCLAAEACVLFIAFERPVDALPSGG